MATTPFPRFRGLKGLTWNQCFALDRAGIQKDFIEAMVQNSTDNSTKKIAALLLAMTNEDQTQTQSTAIMEGYKKTNPPDPAYPKILPLQPRTDGVEPSKLGRVFWSPMGVTLKLYCHSIFDLLGACMSDAAYQKSTELAPITRKKDNYYALLASLYSYWCFRLYQGGSSDRRPTMIGIACLGDTILLGCSIPTVPGEVATIGGSKTKGKEIIRQSRFADLQTRGRSEGSATQTLDLNKIPHIIQDYGNCAETWSFALLCTQEKDTVQNAYGIAVRVPSADVTAYDANVERTTERYEDLCGNCRRLIMQIAIWDTNKKDTVVKHFNTIEWTLK